MHAVRNATRARNSAPWFPTPSSRILALIDFVCLCRLATFVNRKIFAKRARRIRRIILALRTIASWLPSWCIVYLMIMSKGITDARSTINHDFLRGNWRGELVVSGENGQRRNAEAVVMLTGTPSG